MAVRFRKPYDIYNTGETAGWPDQPGLEDELVRKGLADRVGAKEKPPAPPADTPPVETRDPEPVHRDPAVRRRRA